MKKFIKKLRAGWRRYLLALLLSANGLTWYAVVRESRAGLLTVAFLDVGQGDAIFIEAPNGNQILLDGGPDKKILRALGEVLPFYDRSLDLVAVSHPHKDHIAGLNEVLARYHVGVAFSSGTESESSDYELWRERLALGRVEEVVARRGMRINMGDGVVLRTLLPSGDVAEATPHDGMLVMQLHYGETSIMLTGDVEEPLERYLVGFDGTALKSNILKVGHHGSRTSSSLAFVGSVAPQYAVIQSGVENSFGHPHTETISILEQFNIEVLRNDQLGTIIMKSDGRTFSLMGQ